MATDLSPLLARMERQLAEWDREEPRCDWWNYQRDYAERIKQAQRQSDMFVGEAA